MTESFCPYCEKNPSEGRTAAFDWGLVASGEFPRFAQYASALTHMCELRLGSLWTCRYCDYRFWLDDQKKIMAGIPPKNRASFERWSRTPPVLTPKNYALLEALQPLETHKGCRDVPASVRFNGYSQFSTALIRIEANPQILFWIEENIRIAPDIVEIAPSPYALPYSVREATHSTRSIEYPDGFCEFEQSAIQSPAGRVFLVDGLENFFAYRGFRGPQMKLRTNPSLLSKLTRPVSVGFPRNLVTWVLAEPNRAN
jgi:hypothetical protein